MQASYVIKLPWQQPCRDVTKWTPCIINVKLELHPSVIAIKKNYKTSVKLNEAEEQNLGIFKEKKIIEYYKKIFPGHCTLWSTSYKVISLRINYQDKYQEAQNSYKIISLRRNYQDTAWGRITGNFEMTVKKKVFNISQIYCHHIKVYKKPFKKSKFP
jgi:hypothetical protein